MSRELFVNLPVRNLERSIGFFRELGFEFNPNFTDETAACMLIGDRSGAMLLTHERFRDFTSQQLCDTSTHTEALVAFSVPTREDVARIAEAAIAHGGRSAGAPQDHGFMYQRAFYDLDGHHWEVFWMDPQHASASS